MVRRLHLSALVATATIVIAGCGSNSTHVQSYSPTPSGSGTTATSPTTIAPTKTSALPPTSAKVIPTPTVTPPAQGAVDAYIRLQNLLYAASLDPANANTVELNKYLDGKALKIYDAGLASLATSGFAYRGSPPVFHVKIDTVLSDTAVFLTSCPTNVVDDPYTRYSIKTGQSAPLQSHTPPPPYLQTLPMKKVGGQWKLTDLLQDTSKTCRP